MSDSESSSSSASSVPSGGAGQSSPARDTVSSILGPPPVPSVSSPDKRERHSSGKKKKEKQKRSSSISSSEEEKKKKRSRSRSRSKLSKRVREEDDESSDSEDEERAKIHEEKVRKLLEQPPVETNITNSSESSPSRNFGGDLEDLAKQVYVGGFPRGVQAEALKEFMNLRLKSHPALAGINFDKGSDVVVDCKLSADGGYAFVDVQNATLATAVIALSNGLDCAGHLLKIGRPTKFLRALKTVSRGTEDAEALQALNAGGNEHADLLIQGLKQNIAKQEAETPSKTVSVVNLLTAEMLKDTEEMEDTRADLQEELGRIGKIQELRLPKPSENPVIYVTMSSVEEAAKVKETMQVRTFDGRQLQCNFAHQ